MEHSGEYYKAVVRVIDYVGEGNRNISAEKGLELAGGNWSVVGILFKERGATAL